MAARNIGILMLALQRFEIGQQVQREGAGSLLTMSVWHTISFWVPLVFAIVLFIYAGKQSRG